MVISFTIICLILNIWFSLPLVELTCWLLNDILKNVKIFKRVGGYEKGEKTLLNAVDHSCDGSFEPDCSQLISTSLTRSTLHRCFTNNRKRTWWKKRPRCIPAVKRTKLSVSHEILNGTSLKTLQTRKRRTLSQDFFNLLLFFIAVYDIHIVGLLFSLPARNLDVLAQKPIKNNSHDVDLISKCEIEKYEAAWLSDFRMFASKSESCTTAIYCDSFYTQNLNRLSSLKTFCSATISFDQNSNRIVNAVPCRPWMLRVCLSFIVKRMQSMPQRS